MGNEPSLLSFFEMLLERDMSSASAFSDADLRCSPGRREAFVGKAFLFVLLVAAEALVAAR